VGQPGCGHRLPQPVQLTIGEELLGYHNNNNSNEQCVNSFLMSDLLVLPVHYIACACCINFGASVSDIVICVIADEIHAVPISTQLHQLINNTI